MPAYWDTDVLLRTSELASTATHGGDLVMLLSNGGTVVTADDPRRFPDGKARIGIAGFTWGQIMHPDSAATAGERRMLPLTVVRRVDSATGSISSLMYSRTPRLEVCISAYRAGGDASGQETLPLFEIKIEEGQLIGQYFHTGGTLDDLTEVLVFGYRSVTVRSWPQQGSGSRGGVRECVMSTAAAGSAGGNT